jgi:hypothetical protein
MHYMLFMCDDGSSDTLEGTDPRLTPWLDRVAELGVEHRGSRLRPKAEAVTVRVRDGQVLVSGVGVGGGEGGDGPFAETEEQICGFEVVDCADLDVALEVAGSHPSAQDHAIEIRPFWED